MHVQYVAICEQVILSADGKPSLIGIVNDIQAPAVPFTIPRLAFAARVLFTSDDAGSRHTVEVVIRDPSDTVLGRPGGDLELPVAPPGADSIAVDLPIQFDLFQVGAFGRYTFLLRLDDADAAAVQLNIRQGTPQGQVG
jgi:hypothetical protein